MPEGAGGGSGAPQIPDALANVAPAIKSGELQGRLAEVLSVLWRL